MPMVSTEYRYNDYSACNEKRGMRGPLVFFFSSRLCHTRGLLVILCNNNNNNKNCNSFDAIFKVTELIFVRIVFLCSA